jgi:hypothetical protein
VDTMLSALNINETFGHRRCGSGLGTAPNRH